jgi:hypothetical protein
MRLVDVLTQSGAPNYHFAARPHRSHGRKRHRREREGGRGSISGLGRE